MEPGILSAIWRYRWLVLIATLLLGWLALLYANASKTEEYVAKASMVVQDPRAASLFETDTGRANPARYVADQVAILESSAIAERAAELAAMADPPVLLDADDIDDGTAIRSDGGSDAIDIFFTAADAHSAVTAVNAVAEAYTDVRRSQALQNAENSVSGLDDSIGAIKSEIAQIKAEIDSIERTPIRQELERQYQEGLTLLGTLFQQLDAASDSTEHSDIVSEIEDIDMTLRVYATVFALQDPDSGPGLELDPEVQASLEQQAQEAIARLTELQPELAGTADQDDLTRIRAAISDLQQRLDILRTAISIEDTNVDTGDLVSQRATAIDRLAALTGERDRILVDAELLSGGVILLSPATSAGVITSDVTRTVILGILAGLIAGGALAYLLAIRRRRISDRHEPERILGAPLLSEVPVLTGKGPTKDLPVRHAPYSVAAEAFRFVAAALDVRRRSDESGPVKNLITSAVLGDGKTVVAGNTALAAAHQGMRVLALDADFGSQRLTELLLADDTEGHQGLTDLVLAGAEMADAIRTVAEADGVHLDVLSRGTQPTTAPEFFRLDETRAVLDELAERYDLVVIDAPPLLQVAFTSSVARLADQVIVVVPHDGRASLLDDLVDRLQLIGQRVAGYVYNRSGRGQWSRPIEGSLSDTLGRAMATRLTASGDPWTDEPGQS